VGLCHVHVVVCRRDAVQSVRYSRELTMWLFVSLSGGIVAEVWGKGKASKISTVVEGQQGRM
jgi:hypothetical protein